MTYFPKKKRLTIRELSQVEFSLHWFDFLPWIPSLKVGIEKNIVVKFSFLFLSVFHAKDVSSSLKKRSQPRTDSTRSESRSQSYPSHLPILTPSRLKSPCPPAATSQPLRVMGACVKSSVRKTGHQLAIYINAHNWEVHYDWHCWLPVPAINRGLCQLMDSDFLAFGLSECQTSSPTGQAKPRK